MTNRRGITLLEVVVVISIIAVLLAVMIPAVQWARESTRRVQCQNNLRQVALAAHSFHENHRELPSFYNGTELSFPLDYPDCFQMHSWRVPLLPHLEQSALRGQLEWEELATEPANAAVAQTAVPTYLCPSGSDPFANMGSGVRRAAYQSPPPDTIPEKDRYYGVRSDYDALAGVDLLSDPPPDGVSADSVQFVRWGAWGQPHFENNQYNGERLLRYQRGRFRDITGGLSKTILVSECGGKPRDMKNGKLNVTDDNPDAEYIGQAVWSASNTIALSLNRPGVGVNEWNSVGIYSLHPGGAHVAMADGSVCFLSDSTNFDTLAEMIARSDSP